MLVPPDNLAQNKELQELAEKIRANQEKDSQLFSEKGLAFFKIGFVLILVYLIYYTVTNGMHKGTFLDLVSVLPHELGHLLICIPLSAYVPGSIKLFLCVLAGTIAQLLLPIFVIIYFGLKKKWYSAGFGLFWLGKNFTSIAPYIADARCKCLDYVSLSGESSIHDWNYMLGQFGLLNLDKALANAVFWLGILVMVLAVAGMVWEILFKLTKKEEQTGSVSINV